MTKGDKTVLNTLIGTIIATLIIASFGAVNKPQFIEPKPFVVSAAGQSTESPPSSGAWQQPEEVEDLPTEVSKGGPVETPTPTPTDETNIIVKVSHYNPELGGVNCLTFKNGKCISKLANGEDWEKYITTKNVIACPKELPLGTKIKVLGRVWICKDRGSKITKTEDGRYWIDMLVRETPITYGAEVEAKIIK